MRRVFEDAAPQRIAVEHCASAAKPLLQFRGLAHQVVENAVVGIELPDASRHADQVLGLALDLLQARAVRSSGVAPNLGLGECDRAINRPGEILGRQHAIAERRQDPLFEVGAAHA